MNIHLDHKISEDGSTLTIIADDEEREKLRQMRGEDPDKFGTTESLVEAIESLLCNSDLNWIDPMDTGDLTDAPMFGILGEETTEGKGPFGSVLVGSYGEKGKPPVPWYQPIIGRWAYMDYQIKNPLEELIEHGFVEFTGGMEEPQSTEEEDEKWTEEDYVAHLNETYPDVESDEWIIGGVHRFEEDNYAHDEYGQALRDHDPIAFQAGFNEWLRDNNQY